MMDISGCAESQVCDQGKYLVLAKVNALVPCTRIACIRSPWLEPGSLWANPLRISYPGQ